jgi:CubicO group peptidase (beta-lactamase class C family)
MPVESSKNTFRQLGEFIQAEMQRLGVPGVAVGVFHNGEEYADGFGVTSVENPLPVTDATLFQIGSTTKTVTATVAMRLVEQGKLDLDRPVRAYLPSLRLADESVAVRVTLRQLFSHVGGWFGDYFDDVGAGDDALARVVDKLAALPQLAPLGQYFSYNNAGFYIAGRVIEVVTGQPYETVVKESLFAPLGMDRSFFFPDDVITYRFAVGHLTRDEKPTVARPWSIGRALNPVGGISSTVRDQLRYARFHLGDGTTTDGTRLLSRELLVHMRQPVVAAGYATGSLGVTWMIGTVGGVTRVRHGGATLGQLSAFELAPERGFALTVLTNADHGDELHRNATAWAFEHFLGAVEPEPPKLELTSEQLGEFAGRYEQPYVDHDLTVSDGGLILQSRPKLGFPRNDLPPAPTPPPTRLSLVAGERLIALDPPFKGVLGDFLRDPDGRVGWIRFGSRLARRARPD